MSVNKAKKESRAVFTGTVLSVTEDEENHTRTIKLRLLKSWKGALSKEVTIKTGWDDGDCGYAFSVGKTYLVYAFMSSMYTSRKQLTTNICTRTNIANNARKDIEVLNGRRKYR